MTTKQLAYQDGWSV